MFLLPLSLSLPLFPLASLSYIYFLRCVMEWNTFTLQILQGPRPTKSQPHHRGGRRAMRQPSKHSFESEIVNQAQPGAHSLYSRSSTMKYSSSSSSSPRRRLCRRLWWLWHGGGVAVLASRKCFSPQSLRASYCLFREKIQSSASSTSIR